eukprot:13883401-Alexandrium_andersonii.AAC.1
MEKHLRRRGPDTLVCIPHAPEHEHTLKEDMPVGVRCAQPPGETREWARGDGGDAWCRTLLDGHTE